MRNVTSSYSHRTATLSFFRDGKSRIELGSLEIVRSLLRKGPAETMRVLACRGESEGVSEGLSVVVK